MFQGRFNATMKILLNSNIGHTVDDKILHELQQKHPNLSQNIEGILLQRPINWVLLSYLTTWMET